MVNHLYCPVIIMLSISDVFFGDFNCYSKCSGMGALTIEESGILSHCTPEVEGTPRSDQKPFLTGCRFSRKSAEPNIHDSVIPLLNGQEPAGIYSSKPQVDTEHFLIPPAK